MTTSIDILQDSLLLFDQLYDIFHMNDNIAKFLELDCVDKEYKEGFITILKAFNKEKFLKIFNLLDNVRFILTSESIESRLKEEYMNYIIYYDSINEEFLFIKLNTYIEYLILLINLFSFIYDICNSNKFFTSFFRVNENYPYNQEYLDKFKEKIANYNKSEQIFCIRNCILRVIKTIYGKYYKNLDKDKILLYDDTELELEEPELEEPEMELELEEPGLELLKKPPQLVTISLGGKKSKKMNKIKK